MEQVTAVVCGMKKQLSDYLKLLKEHTVKKYYNQERPADFSTVVYSYIIIKIETLKRIKADAVFLAYYMFDIACHGLLKTFPCYCVQVCSNIRSLSLRAAFKCK